MRGHSSTLLRFLLLGGALFLVDALRTERDDILVDAEALSAELSAFEAREGRPPSVEERRALAFARLREEVLVAEARRLGLDQDDLVIRRRLIQKMRFLLAEEPPPPSDAELLAWLQATPERYARPATLSFEHRFYSERSRASPRDDAARALEQAPSVPADPFPLGLAHTGRAQDKVAQELGPEIAAALVAAPPGAWFGPLRSPYGWHLLRLDALEPGGPPTLEDARARLTEDWLEAARAAQLERAEQALVDATPTELHLP